MATRLNLLCIALLASACAILPLKAQTCQTSGDLDDPTRSSILAAGQGFFDKASKGDVAALRQNSIASLASDFSAVEMAVKDHQQSLAGAKASTKSIFLLEADGTAPIPHAEFYCGVFGKNGQTAGSAEFFLDNLPPGKYAVAILDSVSPQALFSFSVVLQRVSTDWKLGNLYLKPSVVAGHDSEWFLARARDYKTKNQVHNAWLFFLEARSLISPLPFMSTQATDKLYDEMQGVQAADVPEDGKTANFIAGGATYVLTALFPEGVGNDLDLVVKYQTADVSNTNQTNQNNVALMKALLTKYPEFREAFAAVVVRAVDPTGHDFGTLLATKEIK